MPALLNHYNSSWPNDTGAAFSAIVQLGPIVGIIAYFRKDLARYVAGVGRSLKKGQLFPKGDTDARLGWYALLATIPLVVAGLALEKKVDGEYRNLYFIAGALIILALILLLDRRDRQQAHTQTGKFDLRGSNGSRSGAGAGAGSRHVAFGGDNYGGPASGFGGGKKPPASRFC